MVSHPHLHRAVRAAVLPAVLILAAPGCSGLSNTEKGAVIGAAGGAAVGGAVGKAAGSTAKGVLIGAAVGGAAGAVIGSRMDDKAEVLEERLEDAEVERVGEGILVTFESGILFDFDEARLRPEARENLAELSGALGDMTEDVQLLVAGHTDSVGSEEYNYQLSERRARSAAEYLESRGVPPSTIEVVALGESEPVATNETEAGRQANRRVEVAIYADEEYRKEMERRHGGG